jgi:hypothetical protein
VRAAAAGLILPAMISYGVYRLVHFFGIFLLITSLGGAVMRGMMGTVATTALSTDGGAADRRMRRLVALSHGIAMFLVLVGGFGMLARLDIGFPNWVIAKLAVLLALGAMLALARRMVGRARTLWLAVPVLALVAAWLAYTKPF